MTSIEKGCASKSTSRCPLKAAVRRLNQIIEWRGKPQVIRVDNGPEYISGTLMEGAEKQSVRLEHIEPG
jgi:putative transposase